MQEVFCNNDQDESYEPLKSVTEDWNLHKTTMFLNKYHEDTTMPCVNQIMSPDQKFREERR